MVGINEGKFKGRLEVVIHFIFLPFLCLKMGNCFKMKDKKRGSYVGKFHTEKSMFRNKHRTKSGLGLYKAMRKLRRPLYRAITSDKAVGLSPYYQISIPLEQVPIR